MGLTTKERNKVLNRIRHFRMSGDPLAALRMEQALAVDEMPDPTLMTDEGITTDVPLVGGVDLTLPPRAGTGSGQKAWIEFAAKVSDIDAEVLTRMSRDDIIGALEARGNIPSE